MKSEKNALLDILKALSASGIKYVICGGVACVLQGVERATYDIDLSVSLDEDNINKLIRVTKKFGLIPRIPEPVENLLSEDTRNRWIKEKNAMVYTFVSINSPLQLDIFLSYPKSYDELFNNADVINIDDIDFIVSSKDDLLFAKKIIPDKRDKDLIDIKELNKILDEERKANKEN